MGTEQGASPGSSLSLWLGLPWFAKPLHLSKNGGRGTGKGDNMPAVQAIRSEEMERGGVVVMGHCGRQLRNLPESHHGSMHRMPGVHKRWRLPCRMGSMQPCIPLPLHLTMAQDTQCLSALSKGVGARKIRQLAWKIWAANFVFCTEFSVPFSCGLCTHDIQQYWGLEPQAHHRLGPYVCFCVNMYHSTLTLSHLRARVFRARVLRAVELLFVAPLNCPALSLNRPPAP